MNIHVFTLVSSFAWSFEKINLSMVQVIKGHLVKSYDEEFRTLYARSTVQAQLCPPEGLFQHNGPHGQQILQKSHSGNKLERRNQLRHTLDTVYRKTCERKLGTRHLEERLFEDEPIKLEPLIENGIDVQGQMSQFQSAETMNFLKRHSYAGEGQDGYMPQNIKPRASNWNIRETGNGPNNYPLDNYLQPQIYRGQNTRQSYNGIDKQVLSIQQNMPTLENTSKAFMRTWRIESYLKNPDIPYGDSCDYLDQFEPMDKASSFMQGRMRSSLVFRSTIPEQMEPNRHINNASTGVGSSAAPNGPLHYSSMQWNPTAAAENRMNNDEFMLKRQSLQILDDNRNNTSYGPGRNSYQSVYASLGRAKGRQMITNPDILTDNWQKRHSVADPRSNTEYMHESSGHMYGVFGRMNRSTAGINAQNGGYGLNLNGDQRSVSHYDVKSITGTNSSSTHNWQEPPSRAVSAAVLDVNRKDITGKPNDMGSKHIKSSTNKIKSLLNIPERKEDSFGNIETLSLTSGGSTDTLTAEDEEKMSAGVRKLHQSTTSSVRSSSEHRLEDDLNSSKPRFRTEDHQHPPKSSLPKSTTQKKPTILDKSMRTSLDRGGWSKDRGAENRLYSRFEPFCSFEKKLSPRSAHSFGNTHSQEKSKSLPKGDATSEHNLTRSARGHHENKLEKFFHRVGNLIHKNK